MDDKEYLLENRLVQHPSWDSVGRFFSEVLEPSTVRGYYQPLSMVSLMLDYAMGGRADNLRPFHRTSLLLHALNGASLVIFLYLLFGRIGPAALAAALYGLHPLMVEAIPWVSERKTPLSALFAIWSLILYVRYARCPSYGSFIGCAALMAGSLLSKPSAVLLPVLMLLLDGWPLGRLSWRSVFEKSPLFLIAAVSAIITYISQARTAIATLPGADSPLHVPLVICHNVVFYLSKVFWPSGLSSFYAFPRPFDASQPAVVAGLIGTALLAAVLLASLRWTKALVVGWLFFFVAIFPALGIVGIHAVIAADRHAYLPLIGFALSITWLLARLWESSSNPASDRRRRAAAVAVILAVAVAEAVCTRLYLDHWQTTDSLHRRMIAFAPTAAQPHWSYGQHLAGAGRLDDAIDEYRKAAEFQPRNEKIRNDLGAALARKGRTDEAIIQYREALDLAPDFAMAHNNLALALDERGKSAEAVEHWLEALRLVPLFADARTNLGAAYIEEGKLDEAVSELRAVLRDRPQHHIARGNLGLALSKLGKHEEAAAEFRKLAQSQPRNIQVRMNLAYALVALGRSDEAIAAYREVLRVRPKHAEARRRLDALTALQQPNSP